MNTASWLRSTAGAAALACGALSACVSAEPVAAVPLDEGPADTPPPSPDAAPEATVSTLSFGPCPGGYSGACASVPMPLDWSTPGGKTIPILIDKIVSTQKPKKQIWVLQGGPGGSAVGIIPLALALAARFDDAEILTIEHRGVGASSRLACPLAEAGKPDAGTDDAGADAAVEGGLPTRAFELATCFSEIKQRYGDDLRHYTTTHAARDLARAIALTRREPDVPVFIYGVSYGTYWAQRYLQIEPTGVAGVVLDSILAPRGQYLSKFDTQGDIAAMKVAELCKLDATCSANLGPDPWSRLGTIKQKLDSGFCPEAAPSIRGGDGLPLAALLQQRALTGYAFALLHRFDRCSAQDVTAIKKLTTTKLFTNPAESFDSPGLHANIGFSELWESPPPDAATMKQRSDAAIFPVGVAALATEYAAWPKYPADEYVGKYPTTGIPLLMLAGTLDAQTPIEIQETVKPYYSAPNQTFVSVPTANHAVINQSPMLLDVGATEPKTCGMELIVSFISNPQAPPDTSCVSKIAPLEFTRPPAEVAFLLGTSDMWLGVKAQPTGDGLPTSLVDLARLPPLFLR